VLAGVIAELRKALLDNPKAPVFIKTVPKLGYRFVGAVERIGNGAPAEPPTAVSGAMPPAAASQTRSRWRQAWPVFVLLTAGMGWLAMQAILGRMRPDDTDLQEVAWWRFDETSGAQVVDASGHGNDGALFGGVKRIPGKMGMAVELDGHSGYITRTGAVHALPGNLDSRSITAWVRTNSTNGDATQVFLYGGPNPPPAYQGHMVSPNFMMGLRMDGKLSEGTAIPGLGLASQRRIDDGEWHHVAVTWQGSRETGDAHLYMDGREEASDNIAASATIPGSPWWIGGTPPGTLFRGQIDDLRVFNGALNARQMSALYRCSVRANDLEIDGKPHYFLPIFDSGADIAGDGAIRNGSRDFGGVQFARSDGGTCQLDTLRGTDVGQDLHIAADILVPGDAAGHTTEAGPYFRSRRAAPGDGLIGGTSAGYSVLLYSSGSVVVQRLNPMAVVAFATIPEFDNTVFHHLEMAAVGERLEVALDGTLLQFDQGGKQTNTVSIPPVWNGPPVIGYNRGTAGFAFSARQNRSSLGGQTAKNIRVERTAALLH
jgi:hypothetical protein